jgi:hypothetical protein
MLAKLQHKVKIKKEYNWNKYSACLAQLVEHLPRKQKAKGSTPLTGFFDRQMISN